MKQVRFLLAALLLMVCGIMAHAQKVVVYKHDGTKVEYAASYVKDVKYKKYVPEVYTYTLTDKDGTNVTSKYKCTTTQPVTGSLWDTYSWLSNTLTEGTKIYCDKDFELWWYNPLGGGWENYDSEGPNYSTVKLKYIYTIPSGIEWFLFIKE